MMVLTLPPLLEDISDSNMKRYWLYIFSLLWAQYKLTGVQQDFAQNSFANSTILLHSSYLRITYDVRWMGKEGFLDFLFLPQSAYWIDAQSKVAYEVNPLITESPYRVIVESHETYPITGKSGKKAIFAIADKRLEVLWDETTKFDWTPWLQYLPSEGLGTPARYFKKGIPLQWRLLDERGQVLSEFRLLKVESYEPKASDAQVPYPIKKLGE